MIAAIRKSSCALLCTLGLLLGLISLPTPALAAEPLSLREVYNFAGAASEWYTEEAYWAAPHVLDLDGDGKLEAIVASYSLSVVDAASGALKWHINAGYDRASTYAVNNNPAGKVICDILVQDIDADGGPDIVVGYENGSVSAFDSRGYYKPGWPQKPTDGSIRSLAAADVNGDGKSEIAVGAGVAGSASVWLFSSSGQVLPGWPQLAPNQDASVSGSDGFTAYSYGVFANAISMGNIDSDADLEIIVPTDTAYTNAYNPDGSMVPASTIYGENRPWGRVALYEDYAQEQLCENEGWGMPIEGGESRAELYRAELGHAASAVTDLDGDGKNEVVVTALMTDRTGHTQTNNVTPADTRYMSVAVFNGDRSRFTNPARGYDWSKIPVDLGARLRQYDPVSIATGVKSEPLCVDLDGDGQKEILFNSFNGKMHCFSLNGKESGSWPFRLPQSSSALYEFATPAVTADLNGDGKQEVIFASWTSNETSQNTGVNGALYIVDHKGALLASQPLPNGYATYEGVINHSNDALAAPTVCDIDGDGKQEILVNTTYRALCAFEVSGSAAGGNVAPPVVPTITPSDMAAQLDGKALTFKSYLLDGSNYVKLRDVAKLLSGTKAQFEVTWSAAAGIGIQKNAAYTAVGGELVNTDTTAYPYTAGSAKLSIDGNAKDLSVCTVNGNNYFKLRDLGQALNFQVGWDNNARCVLIDSTLPYSG